MDHDAGRFVDRKQVVVLVEHVEREHLQRGMAVRGAPTGSAMLTTSPAFVRAAATRRTAWPFMLTRPSFNPRLDLRAGRCADAPAR